MIANRCLLIVTLCAAGIFPGAVGVSSAQLLSEPTKPDSVVAIVADAHGLPLVPREELPWYGTFWVVRNSVPSIIAPLPCPPLDQSYPVYAVSDRQFLVDETDGPLVLLGYREAALTRADYVAITGQQMEDLVNHVAFIQEAELMAELKAMESQDASTQVSTGGDGGLRLLGEEYSSEELWIEVTNVSTNEMAVMLHNTVPDEEYEILSSTNLSTGLWTPEPPLLLASSGQTPATLSIGDRTNQLFLRARSWVDSQGGGLPDWWQLEWFGETDIDPYGDPDQDGWANIQEYQNGTNPQGFDTPPAPTGLHISFFGVTTNLVFRWNPSPGLVTNYVVQRHTIDSQTNLFNTGLQATFFDWPATIQAEFPPLYRVKAQYASGDSSWSAAASVYDPQLSLEVASGGGINFVPSIGHFRYYDPSASANALILRGEAGRLFLATGHIPSAVAHIRITSQPDTYLLSYPDGSGQNYNLETPTPFSISPQEPVAEVERSLLNSGFIELPESLVPPFGRYLVSVQSVGHDGAASDCRTIYGLAQDADSLFAHGAVPFLDGRRQIKQNVEFQLRSAQGRYVGVDWFYNLPWTNEMPLSITRGFFHEHAEKDYVYSGFHWLTDRGLALDPFRPFGQNYFYANFLFAGPPWGSCQLNPLGGGNPLNLPYMDIWGSYTIDNPSIMFSIANFVQAPTNDIPAQLSSPASDYIYLGIEGLSSFTDDSRRTNFYNIDTLYCDFPNLYGLRLLSAIALHNPYCDDPSTAKVLLPGESVVTDGIHWINFFNVERPVLIQESYYFARAPMEPKITAIPGGYETLEYASDPRPGEPEFDVTATNALMIMPVGQQVFISAWARQRLSNGLPGKFAFLEQYFDKALRISPDGTVTTNEAGKLSPYGEFFPTMPGPAALITMPDIDDPNQRGTGVVHVIKLQLDVNHDGEMDLSFGGPDNTSLRHPFTFWANNDYDRWNSVDGSDLEQDDLERVGSSTYWSQTYSGRDYAFLDYQGKPAIPCQRDLEDYTRLWMPGLSNLMAVMPINYTVRLTLNGGGQIRLFRAVEADGGTNYLFDELTASNQVVQSASLYVGVLSSSSSINLSSLTNFSGHFIWCGVTNGSAEVHLQILDGTNMVADTAAYLEIRDIKQMYERWTVGDVASRGPYDYPYRATEDLPPGSSSFQYGPPESTNAPYILFVHGWNVKRWEKDRWAETAFKRLYWQGYQGRFGILRWPTDNGFDGLWDAITDRRNYDSSEFNAWRSASLLSGFLRTNLNAQYPERVYVMAHSMGNVVASEALRLATNQVVKTYIASQAAIPAHTYDGTIAPYSFTFLGVNFGPRTPNIYSNWFTAAIGTGRRINFYNTNDYALQRQRWEVNQLLKPDQATLFGWNYLFDGLPHDNVQSYTPGLADDDPPWDHFQKEKGLGAIYFNIASSLTDRYEVMSYAAQSRSTALGRTPAVGNITGDVNLGRSTPPRVWPPDPEDSAPNQYSRHKWHSAQFRSTNMRQKGYWQTLLSEEGFDIAP